MFTHPSGWPRNAGNSWRSSLAATRESFSTRVTSFPLWKYFLALPSPRRCPLPPPLFAACRRWGSAGALPRLLSREKVRPRRLSVAGPGPRRLSDGRPVPCPDPRLLAAGAPLSAADCCWGSGLASLRGVNLMCCLGGVRESLRPRLRKAIAAKAKKLGRILVTKPEVQKAAPNRTDKTGPSRRAKMHPNTPHRPCPPDV